jgi:2-isopropylmalate synthase
VVGKTSDFHVTQVLNVTLEENLAMIKDSVGFLAGLGREVIYDAEHFFDGYRADPEYALATIQAARQGGADLVVLCDTNGGRLPSEVSQVVGRAAQHLGTPVGIHTHNDCEMGVANTIAAVQAGAVQVQGTMNGLGERTGNANLTTIIANLALKMGHEVISYDQLAKLTETAHFLDELLNRAPDPRQPYVGKFAFAHKGGLHVAAVREEASTFEHVDPAMVGNQRDLLISELSGRGTVAEKAAAAGITLDDAGATRLSERVKELEHGGYHFEAADGSFELLMRRETGAYEPLFELESWRVIVEQRAGGRVETEATIKIWVAGERYVRTAEGNGPVHALDAALRAAIGQVHPHLRDIELTDFKVRILDSTKGTGATTRVLIDASDGHETWGSIGVDENLIAASWEALVDSLARSEQSGRRGAAAAPAAEVRA